MVDYGVIATRYARALLIHATKRGEQEHVCAHVDRLMRSLRSHPALGRVLADPLIDPDQKVQALTAAAGGQVCQALADFIALVVRERREEQLMLICLDYIRLLHRQQHLTEVRVTTAVAIDKTTERAFEQKMEHVTGGKVALRTRIDPALVGGYILRWDTYRLDRSVRGALRNIEKGLTQHGNTPYQSQRDL